MSRKRKGKSKPRFLQLHHHLLKSHAWHTLTPLQRAGYIEIAQLYDGSNNGRLAMSARRLASVVPCSKDSDALRALEDAGFIETVKVGKYAKKKDERVASEYRLTDFRCDVTSELPSRRYNPQHRWDPSVPKPKRKPLTVAERVRRHRKKKAERNGGNGDRMNQSDHTVRTNHTVSVTCFSRASRGPRKTAKSAEGKSEDVTTSVLPSHTLIHLTMGGTLLGSTNREKTGTKATRAICDVPDHSTCPRPKVLSLPRGWHWCKFDKCFVTDTGVQVPIVVHPLVGTHEGRAALAFLREWEAARKLKRLAA